MPDRYQVRRASVTLAIAVIDTIEKRVEREYAPDDHETAFADADLWNELDRNFDATKLTAEDFAAAWRATVN